MDELNELSVASSITDTYYNTFDEDDATELAPPKLYGREQETAMLLEAFSAVQSTNKENQVVLVHGESGTGKSSLTDTLREPVCDSNGYFCSGKFFQGGDQEPFSAIVAVFSDLCDVISQSTEYEARRDQLKKELGDDAVLLCKVVSSLTRFLGLQPQHTQRSLRIKHGDDDDDEESSCPDLNTHKFGDACKRFLRAMTCEEHPVVLVFDDIQWMDEGSQQVLESLLDDDDDDEDASLKNTLLIMIYRQENAHDVTDLVEQLGSYVDIYVKNLDKQAVHEIILAVIETEQESDSTRELGALVFQRSYGNPFFVMQFIEMLVQDEYLEQDQQTNVWSYDCETIRKETMLADTLSDVLELKIKRLPLEIQEVLKIASVLGFRFKEDVLNEVSVTMKGPQSLSSDQANEDATIRISLRQAEKDGFVERTSEGYQFTHDKLLSSFHGMIPDDDVDAYHKVIGDVFRARQDEESMYYAAVHLNRADRLVHGDTEKIKLAKLNLEAAKYCQERSAFFRVEILLTQALKNIPKRQRWSKHYYLTQETCELLARIQLVTGNFEACKVTVSLVLQHISSISEKIGTLVTSVLLGIAENDFPKCIESAKKALTILGVSMPEKLTHMQVTRKFMRVKLLLRGKADSEILKMRQMRSRQQSTVVRLLVYQAVAWLRCDDDEKAAYCTLVAMELMLNEGGSRWSSSVLALYSVVELSLGRFQNAQKYGKLALRMAADPKSRDTDELSVPVVTTLVSHWTEPLYELCEPIKTSMTTCYANGDVTFATFSAVNLINAKLFLGENIPDLEVYVRTVHSRLRGLNQGSISRWLEPCVQFMLNLQAAEDSWRDLIELSGEFMDEGEFTKYAVSSNQISPMIAVRLYKLQLAYHFGFPTQAESVLDDLASLMQGPSLRYHFDYYLWQFYGALTYYQRYRDHGQRKHLRKARAAKKILEKFADCPNSAPLLTLLVAEDASLKRHRKIDTLEEPYVAAIGAMKAAGMVHMEGLVNERLGAELLSFGDPDAGKRYLMRAIALYADEWGATAKADWLEAQCGELVEDGEQAAAIAVTGSVIRPTSIVSYESPIGN